MMNEEFLNQFAPQGKQLIRETKKRIFSFLPLAEEILPGLKTGENLALIQSWGTPALKRAFTEKKIRAHLEKKFPLEYVWEKIIKSQIKKGREITDEFLKQIIAPVILEARKFWQDLYQRAIDISHRRQERENFLTRLKQDWSSDIIGSTKAREILGYIAGGPAPLKKLVQQGMIRSSLCQGKYYYPLTDIEKIADDNPEKIIRRKNRAAERKKQQDIDECLCEIKLATREIQTLEKQIKDGEPYIDLNGTNYTEMNIKIYRSRLPELQEKLRQLTE